MVIWLDLEMLLQIGSKTTLIESSYLWNSDTNDIKNFLSMASFTSMFLHFLF